MTQIWKPLGWLRLLHPLYPVRPLRNEGDEHVFTLCQGCVFLSDLHPITGEESAELPLIGRTVKEELRVSVEPRVSKVVAAAKRQQYT